MTNNTKLRFIPLGGVGEIGKSCAILEYGNSAVMIDCGLAFPDIHLLGVDLVIPDFTYALRHRGKLKAVFLTHGHEDHIGALPYLLNDFIPPKIYGSKLTLGLLKSKIEEVGIEGEVPLIEIGSGDKVQIDKNFEVSAFHISHSIPDELAYGISTPVGKVFFSGDFKVDQSPVDGRRTEIEAIRKFAGEQGILALFVDTTNVERPGWTGSESVVGPVFMDFFKSHSNRILITTFASNIHRIQQALDTAKETGRKVFLAGRAMLTNVALARELGYLKVPEDTIVEPNALNRIPPKELVILATGSQGEPMAALTQMSREQHRFVSIHKGDLVIFSASPIPGNETYIYTVIDNLFRLEADVIYGHGTNVHVSGHGSQEEIMELLKATRARFLVPIHSQYRHQMIFKKLARKWGHPDEDIITMSIGDVLEFNQEGWEIREHIKAGATYIDGLSVGTISTRILSERTALAEDGVVSFTLVLDSTGDTILRGPFISARGFPAEQDNPELFREMKELLTESLFHNRLRSDAYQTQLRNNLANTLQHFIFEKLGFHPVILGTVIHLDPNREADRVRESWGIQKK